MRLLIARSALPDGCEPIASLTLPFELRQKSRFRAVLSNGEEVGVQLDRGVILRGGEGLVDAQGALVRIDAAPEPLSRASTGDPQLLLRAAYHLGNRHVPVAIQEEGLLYGHDHVLDAMLEGLGLEVEYILAPFEPEGGAYGGHSHGHAHAHP